MFFKKDWKRYHQNALKESLKNVEKPPKDTPNTPEKCRHNTSM